MRVMLWLLALASVFLSASATAQTAIDRDAFTREIAQRIGKALGDERISIVAPLELRLANAPDAQGKPRDPATLYLDRIYQFCARNTAEDCEAVKGHFVTSMTDQDDMAPITRQQLRVVVRAADYCAQITQMLKQGKTEPIVQPIAPGLCALLVLDYPRLTRVATAEDLETLKLSPGGAWLIGRERVLADLPKVDGTVDLKGSMIGFTGQPYMASLLLDTDGWNTLARAVGGEIIVAVADDTTVVVDLRARADLPAFHKLARESYDSAERGISPLVYRWTGSGWEVLE